MGIFSRQVLSTFGETSPFKETRAPASKNADVHIPKPFLKREPELTHGSNTQTNTLRQTHKTHIAWTFLYTRAGFFTHPGVRFKGR